MPFFCNKNRCKINKKVRNVQIYARIYARLIRCDIKIIKFDTFLFDASMIELEQALKCFILCFSMLYPMLEVRMGYSWDISGAFTEYS